ncbi:hypothetical protein LCGC14_0232000 [marine sediment metagenome]|uniref:Uncharacterized protein n=1 Tax=marine sediment metagenome TaxID=412755 RepID=A0A0F9URF5_9ZZZZ
MSQASYVKVVNIKTTGSTVWTELKGISGSFGLSGEMLDDTEFSSTGYRSRIRGLKDYNVSLSGNYTSTASWYSTVFSAWNAGTKLDFQYLPNGTKGFQGRGIVDNFSHSGDVGSLETVEVSLQSEGTALTTV